MVNEEKLNEKEEKVSNAVDEKLGNGIEVHYYTFWDSIKGVLLTTVVLSIFISLCLGNIGAMFYIFLPLLFAVWLGNFIIKSISVTPAKEIGITIEFQCPYCHQSVWSFIPSLRMKCPNCKKEVGYHDHKVYKITKNNEMFFKTEQEKTNDLLEEQNQNARKQMDETSSNLDEIKKLKELLDMEAITKEEFEEKKKELLKEKSG